MYVVTIGELVVGRHETFDAARDQAVERSGGKTVDVWGEEAWVAAGEGDMGMPICQVLDGVVEWGD